MACQGLLLRLFSICVCVLVVWTEKKSYEGYKIARVTPHTKLQVELLYEISRRDTELDFLSEPSQVMVPIDVLMPPEEARKAQNFFWDIPFTFVLEDVQGYIDELYPRIGTRQGPGTGMVFNSYKDLETINAWMDIVVEYCPKNHTCTIETIGKSQEGRPIRVYNFKKKSSTPKPAIWIDAALHGRDWTTTVTVLNLLNRLTNYHRENTGNLYMTEKFDWYLLPVANPDGYAWSFENDPFWRKSRGPTEDDSCVGTDLDRNFDSFWGTEGSSVYSCAHNYKGPAAASEPEVRAYTSKVDEIADRVLIFLSLHAYGSRIRIPTGNPVTHGTRYSPNASCEKGDNYPELERIANATVALVGSGKKATGTKWSYGSNCDYSYAISGTSIEYVYKNHNIKYVYGIDMKGSSYENVRRELLHNCRDLRHALLAMFETLDPVVPETES